jgi:hypothetical protein
MKKLLFVSISVVMILFGAILPASAQPQGGTGQIGGHPDISGIWYAPTPDVSGLLLPGEEIVLTKYGAERYKKVDQADTPSYRCEPYGPVRALQSTNPWMLVQTPNFIGIMMEHIDYRLIYLDGRSHPEDIADYPEWEGHSVGKWEGDTLVIDTVGLRPETWLDTAGFEHGEKLHLTERIKKVSQDVLQRTVTIDDPVFYAKPWTFQQNIKRLKESKNVRMMPARCADNEGSYAIAEKGHQGPEHKHPPKMPN